MCKSTKPSISKRGLETGMHCEVPSGSFMEASFKQHASFCLLTATNYSVPSTLQDDEKFVFPSKCVISGLHANRISAKSAIDIQFTLKEFLSAFKPIEVILLHNDNCYTGDAIVTFRDSWNGLQDALSLENHFLSLYSGKVSGNLSEKISINICGWVARTADYNSGGIIGDYLRKSGCLKTIADIKVENQERQKRRCLILENERLEERKRFKKAHNRSVKENESTVQKHIGDVQFSPLKIPIDVPAADLEVKGTTIIGCTFSRNNRAMLMADSKISSGCHILGNKSEKTCWYKIGCIVPGRIYVGCSGNASDCFHMTKLLAKLITDEISAGKYREEDVTVPWVAKTVQNIIHAAHGKSNCAVVIAGWQKSHRAYVCSVDKVGRFHQDGAVTIGSGSQCVALLKWDVRFERTKAFKWISKQMSVAQEMDEATGGRNAYVIIHKNGTAEENFDGGNGQMIVNGKRENQPSEVETNANGTQH